jgi:diguanylate cyclase (GGDEF)-like protein/PAS domain S-box-containing protein
MFSPASIEQWIGGLLGVLVVLLIYQQIRINRILRESAKREELFRIVAQNAADMIALVDLKGHRLYNSPAYKKVLGYSPEELGETSAFEQIHVDDRYKVLEAAREARSSGVGKSLQYRIRHKNGTWRILESTASTIKNDQGDVEKLVIVNRDITERKQAEQQAEHNSFHDGLTGLPNRRLFLDRLQRAFVRAQRNPGYQYAVLFVDVDGFKQINETFGPGAGDQVITEIGTRLGSCLRLDDTVARPTGKLPSDDALLSRSGGDEFTILLESIKHPGDALRVAKRIQAAIGAPYQVQDRQVITPVSVGIALSAPSQQQPEDLLQEAETAMRRAKSLGGSRCEVFDEGMHTKAINRLKLEAELRTAFECSQFRVHYQPIIQLESRQIVGFEALVRWNHPEQGLISPYKFIEAAEDMGLLVSIGQWVIAETCKQMSDWQARYPAAGLYVTVNASGKQFAHPHFAADVRVAMQGTRLDPDRLQLEISEAVAMADPKLTANVLSQLKHHGVRIGIDDVGSAYSSLAWLRRFPLDVLKIDRSLVETLLTDRASADIVQLIVTMARSLNLQVVAEGIEAATQHERLRKLGCEFGQGYLFSQPVDADAAQQLIRQQSARGTAAGGK